MRYYRFLGTEEGEEYIYPFITDRIYTNEILVLNDGSVVDVDSCVHEFPKEWEEVSKLEYDVQVNLMEFESIDEFKNKKERLSTHRKIIVEREHLRKKNIEDLNYREELIVETMKYYYWNQIRIICVLMLLFMLIFGIIILN